MEKIKYKIDKKELTIWITLFILSTVVLAFSLLIIISGYAIDVRFVGLLLFVLLAFLSYYLTNQYRLKKFYFLCNEIEKHKINFKYEELYIKIKQKSYSTTPLKQSRIVKIEVPLYTVKAHIIHTSDFFILFFAVNDFGLFKKYIKPFLFKKENGSSYNFMKDTLVIEKGYEMKRLDCELIITLKKPLKGIEKIIIPADKDLQIRTGL